MTLGAVGTAFNTANTGATITTGSGDDFVSLDVGAGGVLKAIDLGTHVTAGDTLALASSAGTGLTIIDLSSTTDQIQQLLGSANAAAQVGIENINLSGFTQTTASTQITGSSGDNVITGGAGIDTVNGGAGNDTITGGNNGDFLTGAAGVDRFSVQSRAESSVNADATGGTFDQLQDFTSGTDKLDLIGDLVTTPLTVAADGAANLNANTQAFDTNFNTTVANAVTALGAGSFANAGDALC